MARIELATPSFALPPFHSSYSGGLDCILSDTSVSRPLVSRSGPALRKLCSATVLANFRLLTVIRDSPRRYRQSGQFPSPWTCSTN